MNRAVPDDSVRAALLQLGMSDQERDNIDLQKLSQRELLIVTHRKVNEIADSLEKISERQSKHEVRISLVEQRVMLWGALFGAVAAIVTQVVVALIKGQ
ncbi:hypothetical protein [Maribellus mangrovi]|uniref:hypothetical protein n=1 Tax=Maribellus mangrovi TaxID=3133146 RepID=UPI0030EBFA99